MNYGVPKQKVVLFRKRFQLLLHKIDYFASELVNFGCMEILGKEPAWMLPLTVTSIDYGFKFTRK